MSLPCSDASVADAIYTPELDPQHPPCSTLDLFPSHPYSITTLFFFRHARPLLTFRPLHMTFPLPGLYSCSFLPIFIAKILGSGFHFTRVLLLGPLTGPFVTCLLGF